MTGYGIGNAWEEKAADYLERNGIRIICRNFKSYRGGEIDLVGVDKEGTLIFFEVKYRRNLAHGHPLEAISYSKMRSICRTSDYYRARYKVDCRVSCRFDVVYIIAGDITWVRNAFMYIENGL